MIQALFYKEWLKIRYIWWLPFILVIASLFDYYWTLLAVKSMHGAINLWAGLIMKESIYFSSIKWAFILSGIWLACFQLLPECTGRRLRVFFHLPVTPKTAFSIIFLFAFILMGIITLCAFIGFCIVNTSFGFPKELSNPMLYTLFPWALAGIVSWCITATIIADPSFFRKICIGAIGYGFVQILVAEQGYNAMKDSFWLYFLCSVPWVFAFPASALRVKEGR